LAEIDIESGLDEIVKKLPTKMQVIDYFHPTIFIYGSANKPDEKKCEEDE